ncbi:hypothetical protein POSPLADRAFT_1039448 [Postia placenta MAD-698-R-SB12]|uniref:F-box domain-containing protein n=1 Tax=Postia placenta MAD-698-R-SB12 TaxID=670580 RepID=A0A1X6N7T8_9APHY|nr:hypothetical protein POSPLADRAFT_1039448 [Postia placenta MAD-698-R-SB12]OSX64572.1 hypothetical protein POSPLADRAFT_1039448 [Postia placenta MAD-698-R-SB12]
MNNEDVKSATSPDNRAGRPRTLKGGGTQHLLPKVPLEISDLIIDELGSTYQRSTLAACALTCRDWLHRSRYHIHAAVRIDCTSNLPRLTELYSPAWGLAGYVRSLSIDACDVLGDGLPAPHPWIDNARDLLRLLTKIERLSLDAIIWQDLGAEIQALLLNHYPLVKDLWMSTCDFRRPSQLVSLLQAFPRIECVRMEAMAMVSMEETIVVQDGSRKELRLQWLDVGDLCTMPSIVARWARSYEHIAIENMHFSWGCEDPAELGQLLERAGPSLKTLSITMDNRIPDALADKGPLNQFLNLGYNSGLRSLRLLLRLEPFEVEDLSWISDLIGPISSTQLRHVAIYMEVLVDDQLDRIKWDVIDSALASEQLSSLQKVELGILQRRKYGEPVDDSQEDRVKNRVTKKLPKLAARPIFEVTYQDA